MNGSLRSILYLATTIAILVLVFKFVSFMLPYVLIAALIIFIYRKIKGTLDYKKEKHEQGSVYTTKPSEEESPFDSKDGEIIDRRSWGLEILNEMKAMNSELNLGKEDIINEAIAKMADSSLTYAYKYRKLIEEKGYIKANVDLAEG